MVSSKFPKRSEDKPRRKFIFLGLAVLLVAAFIPISTFAPVFKAEVNYRLTDNTSVSTDITPADTEFGIVIPKINANAKVISNVDPFDSRIYQRALTRGVAHAKGSSTPDRQRNTFIFAHSAGNWYQANQFNAVFYLLNKLVKGDEIIVYYQSQKYIYTVSDTKLIDSRDMSYISSRPGQSELTLMTCWPPGTTLKRLVVIASLKSD